MNLMFSDIGNSFLNMIQQDIPKEILLNTDTATAQKPVFADQLKKQIDKADFQEKASSQAISGTAQADRNQDAIIAPMLDKLHQEEGAGFISALKEILLKLSKGNLNNFSIDTGGLEALRKMLLTAGLKETDVNEIFAELLEKTKTGKLTLADLMGKLSDLSLEKETKGEDQSESFLEISALPFLESLLNSMGIKSEEIQKIMAEAVKGEKGISLDVVIEKLKGFQKESFQTQNPFKTSENDRNYQHLMKQLGMEQTKEKSTSISLNEFVDALENLRDKLTQEEMKSKGTEVFEQKNQAVPSETKLDLFTELFNGLEQIQHSEKSAGFGFSYDQIKSQFENKFLLSNDTNTIGNTLFAVDKDMIQEPGSKQKSLDKNLEVFLTQKKNSDTDLGSLQKDVKTVLKQLRSENSKFNDQLQVSGADARTQDTQSQANELRAKPSLKDLPTYVTHQVSKSLVRAINQGESVLKIQLKPPELGRLVMTIDNTGNNMKISIMTDNQTAKEILVSNMNDIKTTLSNSGVNLERFDVDMNSNFQQSMADAKNQAGNSGKRQQNRDKLMADGVTGINMDDPAGLLNTLNPDGSLHYVA
ncbi:MAG: hypothetical protein A2277_00085 [Desulfobacterales bacterium RIFOXYA12_FULL_46_15]|nr:MAG: hypothetical protein A2277_00085 [Desulfobacterales bacterium RIFOXYA12_FULL_46_15]